MKKDDKIKLNKLGCVLLIVALCIMFVGLLIVEYDYQISAYEQRDTGLPAGWIIIVCTIVAFICVVVSLVLILKDILKRMERVKRILERLKKRD
jgi:uncharacterized membrane protein YbhN (UPF0104 family)